MLRANGGTDDRSNEQSKLVPVDLVFMFDESGSMDNDGKWDACGAGLKQFFADPSTAGMRASIQYFPVKHGDESSEGEYASPHVPMRVLPGGTQKAIVVDAQDPNKTTANMLAALDVVKGTIGCEVTLPTSASADPHKVDVTVTPGGALAYDDTCAGGRGWHYDVPSAPKKVVLCAATSADARGNVATKIEVEVGCATHVAPH